MHIYSRTIENWLNHEDLDEHQIEETRLNYERLCDIISDSDHLFRNPMGVLLIALLPLVWAMIYLTVKGYSSFSITYLIIFSFYVVMILISGATLNNRVSIALDIHMILVCLCLCQGAYVIIFVQI